ncbi:MAG: F0F1 ATP synthase subunit A [Eubacteriales bacterium]
MKSQKQSRSVGFAVVDILCLGLAILPFVFGMVLRVLTREAGEGISITGAQIFFTIQMPFQDLPISEAQVNSWLIVLSILGICLYLTHGLVPGTKGERLLKRQIFAEWIVEKTQNMVLENMGQYFKGFAPFIAAIMGLSALSSLSTLIGLYPPTSDLNIIAGWAIVVFLLITYYKFKGGALNYFKSYAEPVAILTPINIISEVATPVSMTFRHYGNVLSGTVISALLATGLQGLSALVLGRLPGVLGEFPLFQIGIPAVLSLYFDIFSGCLQAFIFAMLTMLYIANGFPEDKWQERQKRRAARKAAKAQS